MDEIPIDRIPTVPFTKLSGVAASSHRHTIGSGANQVAPPSFSQVTGSLSVTQIPSIPQSKLSISGTVDSTRVLGTDGTGLTWVEKGGGTSGLTLDKLTNNPLQLLNGTINSVEYNGPIPEVEGLGITINSSKNGYTLFTSDSAIRIG